MRSCRLTHAHAGGDTRSPLALALVPSFHSFAPPLHFFLSPSILLPPPRAGENSYVLEKDGQTHYMRGGKPGYMPTFDQLPHPVPFNLFDPFGFSKSATPEKKAKGLLAEVNNGRLAMIGIMGFLSEAKVPGSVPGLAGVGIRPYDGDVMAPFDANFHLF